ncbi:Ras like GTPase [Akanthomyces lecanii RCEF 1005]|uniref:Ras like GTPase n=1 Tax=Akanthomyces lecanii RCEF 1005 TaxID=1081108 RepID=A0A168FPM4_CORDF|nr:Ras like GTPase [Akanthomyces lecanii RCEF 1005]
METPAEPSATRRPSFGSLLRRTKSGDLGKKAQAARDAELQRQRERRPPRLPDFANTGNGQQLAKALSTQLRLDPTHFSPNGSPAPYNGPNHFNSGRQDSSFGSSITNARSYTSSVAPPPIPGTQNPTAVQQPAFDPYAATESMTHRGRYSYASSAISTINSPRRVRRRKDPTPFNVLVIGSKDSGKTSFLEFLKTALALPPRRRPRKQEQPEYQAPLPAEGNFVPHYLETEIDGESIGLTIWDSEGLEKNVVDLQLREMSAFIESKFEQTFAEEMKVVRSPGVQDTHIHAVFLMLDPSHIDRNITSARKAQLQAEGLQNGFRSDTAKVTGALDHDMDLQVLRSLHRKTTVIPVVGKADTITTKHMNVLKRAVWDSIRQNGLDPLETLGLEDDSNSVIDEEDEDVEADSDTLPQDNGGDSDTSPDFSPVKRSPGKRVSSQTMIRHKASQENKEEELPFLPLSTISPDLYEPSVVGRQFPWGFADPYNETHCDFQRLKEAVFSEWRTDLRQASKEQWYEGWRTNKLKHRENSYRRR